MCITGALGIPGSGRDRNYTRNCFVSKTYDFNVVVGRSFNLKVLVEVFIIIFLFIGIYIYFFFQAGVFMGFSITSAVFGGIIIFFYGIGISLIISKDAKIYYDNVESYNKYYHVKVVILPVMLIMGIATFVIGIWAAICTCLLKPCCEQPEVQ